MYSFYVNQGTVGDDLITLQLNNDQWTLGARLPLPTGPSIPAVDITVANHAFSPAPITFQLVNPETGVPYDLELEDLTVYPGEEIVVTVDVDEDGADSADVFIKSIGAAGNGTYIISSSITPAAPVFPE